MSDCQGCFWHFFISHQNVVLLFSSPHLTEKHYRTLRRADGQTDMLRYAQTSDTASAWRWVSKPGRYAGSHSAATPRSPGLQFIHRSGPWFSDCPQPAPSWRSGSEGSYHCSYIVHTPLPYGESSGTEQNVRENMGTPRKTENPLVRL